MSSIEKLYELVKILRSPRGCPWDREQTNESLKHSLIEESYEVLEAIESGDYGLLKEELGDVLFLTLLHIRIAEEAGKFTLDELAESTRKKMIERHPHVFGKKVFKNREELLANWERSKEKGPFEGITMSLPALMLAQQVSERAKRLGFDWPDPSGVLDKVEEEIRELKEAYQRKELSRRKEKVKEELGDIFFALANLSRHLGIEAEESLRGTVKKFIERFQLMEKMAKDRKTPLENLDLDEMEELWQEAKKRLSSPQEERREL